MNSKIYNFDEEKQEIYFSIYDDPFETLKSDLICLTVGEISEFIQKTNAKGELICSVDETGNKTFVIGFELDTKYSIMSKRYYFDDLILIISAFGCLSENISFISRGIYIKKVSKEQRFNNFNNFNKKLKPFYSGMPQGKDKFRS
jgi:hypothetical protein